MIYMFDCIRQLLDVPGRLTQIQRTLYRLERHMSDLQTQFDQTLSDLGQAIDELATRIDSLPATPAEIDQSDLDALKSVVRRAQVLAQASPQIPIPGSTDGTTDQPTSETPGEAQPVDGNGNPIPTPDSTDEGPASDK